METFLCFFLLLLTSTKTSSFHKDTHERLERHARVGDGSSEERLHHLNTKRNPIYRENAISKKDTAEAYVEMPGEDIPVERRSDNFVYDDEYAQQINRKRFGNVAKWFKGPPKSDIGNEKVDKRHDKRIGESFEQLQDLYKRGNSCKDKFKNVSPDHTACLDVTTSSNSGITNADKKMILNKHNRFRGNLEEFGLPTATNMLKMSWNKEIAAIAQKWADNCQFKHDEGYNRNIPGKITVGQNIALGQQTWADAITDWFDEYKNFKYGKGSSNGGTVGHFTQLVWASSSHLGCGFAQCSGLGNFYVCNYGPAGNVGGLSTPYSAGKKGRACPSSSNKRSGLCDCGTAICFNGGSVDPDTCKCQCVNAAHIRDSDCALDCSVTIDISQCASKGGPWGQKACREYSNVPYQYCPKTCKLC